MGWEQKDLMQIATKTQTDGEIESAQNMEEHHPEVQMCVLSMPKVASSSPQIHVVEANVLMKQDGEL